MGEGKTSSVMVGRAYLRAQLRDIHLAIREFYRVSASQLLSPRRYPQIVRIRDVFVLIARKHEYSYSELGRYLRRYHSTIKTAEERATRLFETDLPFRSEVETVDKLVQERLLRVYH